ncbi:sulfatase [Galbibacter mesophilus]|uniref:sulfatase n=1 Tax=Galbibacter mesophilus TaxID=379069 RepID=UPI00191EFA2C|nr:sulfatase [Galbibacter mesophilus]MCM5662653.1 sulfatase [Galbibacter mesophilus]
MKQLLLLFLITSTFSVHAQKTDSPNILFIAVDDLRPELGCYGKEYVHSPNLDKLANNGTLFENHFVTVPTCGASRYNLLTGLLPKKPVDLTNQAAAKQIARDAPENRPTTFLQDLKENGYYTVGIGKISHYPDGYVYGYRQPKSDLIELPGSWDEMLLNHGKWGTGHNAFFGYADGTNRNDKENLVKPYEAADVEDTGYPDGLTAELAIEKLDELKKKKKPFFLGVGFFKPHLPFTAPKKYWDLYEEEEIPLAPFPEIPENTSEASLHGSNEFNRYKLGEEKASLKKPLSNDYAKKIKHGYLASVSYVDAQIGKVLDKLEESGLAENTIVVIWGDHGWHLGDQLVWGKHTIFDNALQSVLIIKHPKLKADNVEQVVSTTDIYPTILEMTGSKTKQKIDGMSMVSLMENPKLDTWRNSAYSYFNNGISVRVPNYRLTKYFREETPTLELYNEITDPNETKNIAQDKPKVIEDLLTIWEKGNTGLYDKP